jgi:hypothetical protein
MAKEISESSVRFPIDFRERFGPLALQAYNGLRQYLNLPLDRRLRDFAVSISFEVDTLYELLHRL